MKGEGGVTQRADGRWQGTLDLGWGIAKDGKTAVRKRATFYGRTQREAVVKLAAERKKVAEHGIVGGATTLEKYLPVWLADVATQRNTPKTLTSYRSVVRVHLIPRLGKTRLDRLTPTQIRSMARDIEKTRSSSTALKVHAVLSKALTDAVRTRILAVNPAEMVDRPKVAVSNHGSLTAPQAARFLLSVEHEHNVARWAIAFFLGMRQGECLGLTEEMVHPGDGTDADPGTLTIAWQLQRLPYAHGCSEDKPMCGRRYGGDCPERTIILRDDFEARPVAGGLYLVRPKSRLGWRTVPLVEPLRTILLAHVATPNPAGLLFTTAEIRSGSRITTEAGQPVDPRRDSDAWHAYLNAADLPDVRLHSARHTAVTLLSAAKVGDLTIMSIVGHAKATTTHGYVDSAGELQRDALGRLSAALQIGA